MAGPIAWAYGCIRVEFLDNPEYVEAFRQEVYEKMLSFIPDDHEMIGEPVWQKDMFAPFADAEGWTCSVKTRKREVNGDNG